MCAAVRICDDEVNGACLAWRAGHIVEGGCGGKLNADDQTFVQIESSSGAVGCIVCAAQHGGSKNGWRLSGRTCTVMGPLVLEQPLPSVTVTEYSPAPTPMSRAEVPTTVEDASVHA